MYLLLILFLNILPLFCSSAKTRRKKHAQGEELRVRVGANRPPFFSARVMCAQGVVNTFPRLYVVPYFCHSFHVRRCAVFGWCILKKKLGKSWWFFPKNTIFFPTIPVGIISSGHAPHPQLSSWYTAKRKEWRKKGKIENSIFEPNPFD